MRRHYLQRQRHPMVIMSNNEINNFNSTPHAVPTKNVFGKAIFYNNTFLMVTKNFVVQNICNAKVSKIKNLH